MNEFDSKVEAAIQRAADCATHEGRLMAVAHKRSIAQLARYSLAAWKAERAWAQTRVVASWVDPFIEIAALGVPRYRSARLELLRAVRHRRALLQAAAGRDA